MNTDDLAALLATHSGPVDRDLPARRYRIAMFIGASGALLLMLSCFGMRPDIATASANPMFWFRLLFPAILAAGALAAVTRLARPGVAVGRASVAMVIVPVLAVWLGALLTLAPVSAPERLVMVLGTTWRTCPFNIALLSAPGFIAIFWALKGMAPTRLRAAGAWAGLLSGSVATVAYGLHCPEMGVAFWSVWYLAGILIPTALGAWLGPRLLRW